MLNHSTQSVRRTYPTQQKPISPESSTLVGALIPKRPRSTIQHGPFGECTLPSKKPISPESSTLVGALIPKRPCSRPRAIRSEPSRGADIHVLTGQIRVCRRRIPQHRNLPVLSNRKAHTHTPVEEVPQRSRTLEVKRFTRTPRRKGRLNPIRVL